MKSLNLIFSLFILFVFTNCATKKDILYIQDIDSINEYSIIYEQYKVKVDDILRIDVGSDNPEIMLVFGSNSNNITSNNKETLLYSGFQVNSKGFIDFPNLGKISVIGKTIEQIRDNIYNQIVEKDILINPFVDVKLLNTHFTILGEVSSPGRYEYLKNNLNILEAIGIAGDLTINGDRKEIKILRNIQSETKVFSIDLTKSNFFQEEAFQIISGDIIIVNPNSNKIKNAGIIGNSGTLLSLLSFLLSSIIVISNS